MTWLGAVILRWLTLSALALVLGSLTIEIAVLPVGAAALGAVRRRLRCWVEVGALMLIATTVGQLIVRAQVMTGGDMTMAIRALPLVLGRTHFGAIWIGRSALLVAALVAGASPARTARWSALALVCGVAMTTSLTGHAGDWGDVTPTVGIDLLHVVAASAWTGGLMALIVAVLVDAPAWPSDLFSPIACRFSRLAGWCLAIVGATGIYNATVHVATWAALARTSYGEILLVKILLFLGLMGLGAISRYGIVAALAPARPRLGVRLVHRTLPYLAHLRERPPSVVLSRYVACEVLVALMVFACTALLGEVTPARHAFRMLQHGGAMHDSDSEDSRPAVHRHDERR